MKAAITATLLAATIVLAPASSAAESGPCTDDAGVTVVIDYRELGGGLIVRCAPAPVKDGFDALARAGFTVVESIRSPGFLCRIDNKPPPADDACVDTSPASAYWSYWHSPRGGTWTYSQFGARNRKPPPGSVEGWSFALNRTDEDVLPPGIDPPPRTPTSTAVPSTTPTPTTGRSQPTVGPGVAPATTIPTGGPTPNVIVTTTLSGAATSTSIDPGASTTTPTPTTAAPTDRTEQAASSSANEYDPDSGSGASTAIAVALMLALAAGAAITARRRAIANRVDHDGD